MTRTIRHAEAAALGGPTPPDPGAARFDQLDDAALLGALLGGRDETSTALAERLLARFGSLGGVAAADACALARVAPDGGDALRFLSLARELGVRLARINAARRPVITSASALEAYARTAMAHLPREQFRVLFLDNQNKLMLDEFLAEGTVNHAPVYPREVIRRALELSASALILLHNHPSGDPTPSRADIEMTRMVIDAARCLGLQVHDHLVVGRDGTASFRALGLM